MIILKSRAEIEAMRAAGRVVADAHALVGRLVRPGVSTAEIDAEVEALFVRRGAVPLFKGFPGRVPFPAATCISVEDEVVHGTPGPRRLRPGEIVTVDTGCRLDGWCGDAAWSYPVGRVDALRMKLLESGEAVLRTALREMGRCGRWSQVAAAMQAEAERTGFRLVEEFFGHGIGREMHEDPQVPGLPGSRIRWHDFRLEPGLVVTVEPVLHAGNGSFRVGRDGWTISAADGRPCVHFEHTIAMTDEGPQVLTAIAGGDL